MNSISPAMALARQDQFGRRIAARLNAGAAELPHDISERLRAARLQGGDEHVSLWQRLASALPLIVLAAGLVTIHVVQNERRASEVAEVDAALLTDDLPPAAYADPGFVQFLKSGR